MDRHTRVRVYAPDEEPEQEEFYERKKGADGSTPVNFTAFRQAERTYKCRKTPLDYTRVLDLRRAADDPRVRVSKVLPDRRILYELVTKEGGGTGFCFIPGALDINEQKYWITKAFSNYMSPPNLTNLDAHYCIPETGLYDKVKGETDTVIRRIPHTDDSEATRSLPIDQTFTRFDLTNLIRRIRWVTLGYQYDWTTKSYNMNQSPVPFPIELYRWADDISRESGFGAFKSEAGIVNFYQPGDTLTGHVDRSELNMEVPLVSLSLGASCIFLIGGAGRDDPVTALHLRSGDVVIMSGHSRTFYHGVPRILDPDLNLNMGLDDDEDTLLALEILGSGRLNINIRQVN